MGPDFCVGLNQVLTGGKIVEDVGKFPDLHDKVGPSSGDLQLVDMRREDHCKAAYHQRSRPGRSHIRGAMVCPIEASFTGSIILKLAKKAGDLRGIGC